MEKKTIGTFLGALRKASGLTQKQLAEKLNVSDKAVSRWERDECAPDLSLIPVLAEIYNVTSDEILRGQRCNPDAPAKNTDPVKADKQRKHLLSKTVTKFCIHSVISVAIAIIGLIVISICNFELNAASIAFLTGSIFFAVAIISQIIFTITDYGAIQDDEWSDISLTNSKGSMLLCTEIIVSIFIILFAGTIPLAGRSNESVSLYTCVSTAIPYVLFAAPVCFVTCLIVNLYTFRQLKSGMNRLRLWCSGALSVVLIGLLVGQLFLNNSLLVDRHLYAPCDEIRTLKAFESRMKETYAPDGSPMQTEELIADGYIFLTRPGNEQIILKHSDIEKRLLDVTPENNFVGDHFTAEYGYEFQHLNRSIVYYELTDTDKIVPIYTFTAAQLEAADLIALDRNLQYMLLSVGCILITTAAYLILRRKYA